MKVWLTRRRRMSARKRPGSKLANRWMVAPWHSVGTICMPEACVTGPTRPRMWPSTMASPRIKNLRSCARRLPKVCMAALSTPDDPEV